MPLVTPPSFEEGVKRAFRFNEGGNNISNEQAVVG